MINTQVCRTEHVTVADQLALYSVGFEYDLDNSTGTPELVVTLDGVELAYIDDYTISASGIQLTEEPEAGKSLVIVRSVPLTQEIDFQTGLVDPEQIEHGFDRSVMRDQEIEDHVSQVEDRVVVVENTIGGYGDVVSHNAADFATAAQGAKADTALQEGDFATVATTGSYNDLIDKPSIPGGQVNSDWNANSGVAEILNKPTLGTAAAAAATDFATAAQGTKADTAVQPGDLATVATSGNYSDLSNTPVIPAAQVNSDWNANSGVAQILNKPTIPDTTNMQVTTNLVTSVSSASTDTQYPSAKLFYDTCGDIETLINAL